MVMVLNLKRKQMSPLLCLPVRYQYGGTTRDGKFS